MARITEQNLVLPSLYLMNVSKNRFIYTSDLKKKLVEILKPTGEDADVSPSRPTEIKFMQIVGNLKSHDTFKKNGFATYQRIGNNGGFRITNSGENYLKENYDAIRYFITNDFNWDDLQVGLLEIEKSKLDEKQLLFFDENIIINEGTKKIRETSFYERSKTLRNYAISYYTSKDGKISCNCCSFNFGDFYGQEIGNGFIEIHHTKPIFTYKDEDIENTIKQAVKNLMPVCSNCHRMIHRNWKKPIEIQDLINNINSNGLFKRPL